MEKNSSTKMMICLTIAVVACFIGVAAKALAPVAYAWFFDSARSDTQGTVPDDENIVSLDPNLEAKREFDAQEIIFAETVNDNFYIVTRDGKISVLDENFGITASVPVLGEVSHAVMTDDGFVLSRTTAEGDEIYFVDMSGRICGETGIYAGEFVIAMSRYEDGISAIFKSEGDAGRRMIFRFYRSREVICERYNIMEYDARYVKEYRIQDVFTVFYGYESPFSAGGGYAKFSLSGITADNVNIERNEQYDLLDVIPSSESYALLCSGISGVFIMQLDENLRRFKKYTLTDFTAQNGKMSYDGANYFAFIGGADKGIMFKFQGGFDQKQIIQSYSTCTEIADEYNSGGALTHLCRQAKGYFITDTNGLFTKRINDGCVPFRLLVAHSRTVVAGFVMSGEQTKVCISALN